MPEKKSSLKNGLRVSKKTLLYEATFVWLIAGGMLWYRGSEYLAHVSVINWWLGLVCIIGGFGFFEILFSRISKKYIDRIKGLSEDKNFILSFFNFKGYVLMFIMIATGIIVRKTEIIPSEYMAYFYLFMGTPLLISAFRFFFAAAVYGKSSEK